MREKRLALICVVLLLTVSLCGCVLLPILMADEPTETPPTSKPAVTPVWSPSADNTTGESWAIYIYLCGSDLETDSGYASEDIEEILAVSLPENVKVVIQTGGAMKWHNDYVDARRNYRLVYDHEGIRVDEQIGQQNMGEQDTLSDFMRYCAREHPADRTGYILWNHGAGSVWGVAFDENFDNDSLRLSELRGALEAAYEADSENPPVSFIGLDACLMATVETAASLSGYARYMVASQAVEPTSGWDYTAILSALSDTPDMNEGELCRLICDSYLAHCREHGGRETTLSVVNLHKIDALCASIDLLAREGYGFAQDEPYRFFSRLGREVRRSLLFGEFGTNLYDLGDVLKNAGHLFPDTAAEAAALLSECVVYQVTGEYRDRASGLSFFYSADGHEGELEEYRPASPILALTYLYELLVTGEISEEGIQYLSERPQEEPPVMPQTPYAGLEDHPVEFIEDNAYAVLNLGPEAAEPLVRVTFYLAMYDEDYTMLFLGEDNDIMVDWENGVFTDNFRGVWGSIDGNMVYMEVAYECEDYVLYTIPILLNGESYDLTVSYDYNREEYAILTATPDQGDSVMPSREQRLLRPGDEITTLHLLSDWGEDDFAWYEIESFTVTQQTQFEEIELPDGEYVFLFSMRDVHNEEYTSEAVSVLIDDGMIYMGD